MPEQALSRVELLIQQERYSDAEPLLLNLYTSYPNDLRVIGLLSEVKLHTDQYAAAHELADQAISLAPDNAYAYFQKARILLQEGKLRQVPDMLHHAIALHPEEPDFFALLANVHLRQKQFNEALQQANRALELDGEHLLALNARTTALQKLNRQEEAYQTIEGALREDPNNSYTHANYGWNLLESGDYKIAREHFRESLQLDPGNESAKEGMIQAIKATNPLYRIFLQYGFWMSNLTANYQWGVILGFYVGVRLLKALAANTPALAPYLTPMIVLLMIFAFSTWIITPLSNLLFRLHPFGKFLLDKKEMRSSTFVGISLLASIIGWVMYAVTTNENWIPVGFIGLTMMVPLSLIFAESRYRYVFFVYPLAMLATGVMGIIQTFATGELFNIFNVVYLFAFIAFQWAANFFMIREENYA